MPRVSDALGIRLQWNVASLGEVCDASHRVAALAAAAAHGRAALNPLWLAAQLGEGLPAVNDVEELIFSRQSGVSTMNVVRGICHGDLHGENVLVFGDPHRPGLSVIDFEATHEGHICKDFARLESAVLCRIYEWTEEEASAVAAWFGETMAGSVFAPKRPLQGSPQLDRAGLAITEIRGILAGCGQGHWPIADREYQLAMLGSLLPFIRYPDVPRLNRELALALSAGAASALMP